MTGNDAELQAPPCCLILFTRYPEPGKTKTRLIPALGPEKAALLQKKLTENVVCSYQHLDRQQVSLLVAYTGSDEQAMRQWLGDVSYMEQPTGDLGRRMTASVASAAEAGAEKILLVGSDIPGLTPAILDQAFSILDTGKVVLGPSRDGGFYAIGLPEELVVKLLPTLFAGVKWSTSEVFATIRRRLLKRGHPPVLLMQLSDIDCPEDLKEFNPDDLLGSSV